MKTSHEKLRGVKTKNWIRKIQKLSKSESEYWKKYLEDNEKRLIKRILEIDY
jgi:serine kinase of HPr protein (carbohydrate metabolism regulator)